MMQQSALDRVHFESLRTALQARSRHLREEIRQGLLRSDSEQFVQVAADVRDLEDESFADLVVDVGLAEIDRDLDELREIDAALRRLEAGIYGVCETCDRPIELRRLEAAPHVLRCIDCQTVYERTHVSRAPSTL
jgi:RNA polymerase-binding protein DksA